VDERGAPPRVLAGAPGDAGGATGEGGAGDSAPQALQHLYVALAREPWRSLALVPSHALGDPRGLARALAALGGGQPALEAFSHLDAVGVGLSRVADFAEALSLASCRGRTLISLGPVIASAASRALAERADAVLLCVQMGRADLAAAKRSLALLGHARVLGCVALFEGKPA